MIEYLYDAIRAVAGQDIVVNATVKDAYGDPITENCDFVLHIDGEMFVGESYYVAEQGMWEFRIPAEITKGLNGRYEYCIQHEGENMCFMTPIYLK